MLGRAAVAGASAALSIGVIGAALAVALALQRVLPWHYAALLALVPLAVRLPLPTYGAAARALVCVAYAAAAAGAVVALARLR
jgi:hypothetical protein